MICVTLKPHLVMKATLYERLERGMAQWLESGTLWQRVMGHGEWLESDTLWQRVERGMAQWLECGSLW